MMTSPLRLPWRRHALRVRRDLLKLAAQGQVAREVLAQLAAAGQHVLRYAPAQQLPAASARARTPKGVGARSAHEGLAKTPIETPKNTLKPC